MSHELTINQQGEGEMFSVRLTPWHRLGQVLTEAPTFEEGLRLAGLDFEVRKVPTYLRQASAGVDEFIKSDRAYVTVRGDNGAELGAVGKDYQVVQNRDAFAVIRPLIEAHLASLETGGSLRAGADGWLMVRFGLTEGSRALEQFQDLGVQPFGLIANNHSGRRGVLVSVTPVRVECANTLSMAEEPGLGRQIVIRHTGEAEARVVEAAEELFGGMVRRFERAAAQFTALKRTFLDLETFRSFVVDPVAPDPRAHPRWNPEARMANAVVERYERKVNRLEHLWHHGDGHVGDDSAWEAFNALAQSLDHDEDLWPTRGGVYRTASLMDGALQQRKQRVLETLVDYAEANPS